jgi:rfaE bifunctional protein nucleotidyltransferase chain/domain
MPIAFVGDAAGRGGRAVSVVDLATACALREQLEQERRSVVFTNGCFDLLHVGHVRFLENARRLGDALFVGVNGDASVRALKGPMRPLVPVAERAEIVAALACVDVVVVFEDLRPDRLLALLQPNIHCKGGDYARHEIPEAEHAGTVVLAHTWGHSTSALLAEIVRRHVGAPG